MPHLFTIIVGFLKTLSNVTESEMWHKNMSTRLESSVHTDKYTVQLSGIQVLLPPSFEEEKEKKKNVKNKN